MTNHYKDDVGKVEEYAKNVHTLFGGLPLWIASHLAVWLIQKGYFMAAYRIVDVRIFLILILIFLGKLVSNNFDLFTL